MFHTTSTVKQATVITGSNVVVELDAYNNGVLTRLVVTQTTGTLSGFTYNLYDCDPTAPPNSDSVIAHRILATKTVAAAAATGEDYNVLYYYRNSDTPVNTVTLQKTNKIYLVLNVAGTGSKDFHIGYTVVQEN